jgi:hypothetical protein
VVHVPPDRVRPPAGESGGREDEAAGGGNVGALTLDDPPDRIAELAAQLRRRRAASYRLPPLADGRRDPLDPQAVA